jgi:hypothetical protein
MHFIQGELGEELNISVLRVLLVSLQLVLKLSDVVLLGHVGLVVSEYFVHSDGHILNFRLNSIFHDWQDLFLDHLGLDVSHDNTQTLQAADSVVETLLVVFVNLSHLWDVLLADPVLSQVLGHNSRLLNTHLSHSISLVGQVRQENLLKLWVELLGVTGV